MCSKRAHEERATGRSTIKVAVTILALICVMNLIALSTQSTRIEGLREKVDYDAAVTLVREIENQELGDAASHRSARVGATGDGFAMFAE